MVISLKSVLEHLSKEMNIDLIGVIKARDLKDIEEFLNRRNEMKISTSFEDKNTGFRIYPNLHLEDVKSIIVIGISYNYENSKDVGKFKISNHARGYDYHRILKEKLEELVIELEKSYDFEYKIQVDTGSLLERAYGNLAGLGYFGKNSCLINKDYGSYINLGLLLTTIPVDLGEGKLESQCGDCELCVKSCPSGAILGDYTIDASKCHSYLTQVKWDSEEQNNIRYAYGCDICQRVCPKNLGINKVEYLYADSLMEGFNSEEIYEISNKEFQRRYKNYSFSWVGRKVIERNLRILENK